MYSLVSPAAVHLEYDRCTLWVADRIFMQGEEKISPVSSGMLLLWACDARGSIRLGMLRVLIPCPPADSNMGFA